MRYYIIQTEYFGIYYVYITHKSTGEILLVMFFEKDGISHEYHFYEHIHDPAKIYQTNTITTIIPSDHFKVFNTYDKYNTLIDSITLHSLN